MRFETSVKQKIQRTPDIISIRFNKPKDFEHAPGQFMFIKLNSGGKEMEKHFTISSSPTEQDYIEVTKKLTGNEFANALAALKVGDKVTINAPFGDFTFKGEYDKLGMLSGGIGVTPLRSMIRYCTDKKLKTDIVLLYSNRSEDDIAFKNELLEMQRQNKNLRVINTITQPGKEWKGLTGRINKEMVEKEIPDYMERVFYICGPPKMVDAMVGVLKELNVPDEQIKQEYFPGY